MTSNTLTAIMKENFNCGTLKVKECNPSPHLWMTSHSSKDCLNLKGLPFDYSEVFVAVSGNLDDQAAR